MQVNKGLTKIEFNLDRVKEVKAPKYQFQELALEIIKGLKDGSDHKSSIFKCCKMNETRARKCYKDCQELNKPFVDYFFKLMGL